MFEVVGEWRPVEPGPLLDKDTICQALTALCRSQPQFVNNDGNFNYGRITQDTGVHRGTIEKASQNISVPTIINLEKLVRACGLTLSEFFARLETRQEAKPEEGRSERSPPALRR